MIGEVRLWFEKTGPLKFTSHLDFLRYFQRVIKMSKIPIWYTQGYNPKMYVAFGLPLSLGMTGKNEFAEIRLTEEISKEEILSKLNKNLAHGFRFTDVTKVKMKLSEVSFASFNAKYFALDKTPNELYNKIEELLGMPVIEIEKKSKKGVALFDIAPYFKEVKFTLCEDGVDASFMLPAGSGHLSVSPKLIYETIRDYTGFDLSFEIERTGIYNAKKVLFK